VVSQLDDIEQAIPNLLAAGPNFIAAAQVDSPLSVR
jgi:hypothetical protein